MTPEDIINDPWLKHARNKVTLPDDLLFVCAWVIDIGLEDVDVSAFYRQTQTTDELWVSSGFDLPCIREIPAENLTIQKVESEADYRTGCVFAVLRQNNETMHPALRLLDRYLRSHVGFCDTKELINAGIVDKPAFDNIVERLKNELEVNAKRARQNRTEIVDVAEELMLHPKPTGTGPDYWYATCPGTRHFLFISTASDTFGCGYCKRKGDKEDLRAFANARRGSAVIKLIR